MLRKKIAAIRRGNMAREELNRVSRVGETTDPCEVEKARETLSVAAKEIGLDDDYVDVPDFDGKWTMKIRLRIALKARRLI